MDGVIVDSHPAHRFAWREFLRTFGKEVTDNELDFIMDGRKRKDIFFHFLGPLTDERVQEYGNLKDEFFWQAAPDAVPVPGVFEFIECIRQAGITMAVATSASANRTRDTLQRLGLIETFHGSGYRRRCSRRETRSWHLSTGLPAHSLSCGSCRGRRGCRGRNPGSQGRRPEVCWNCRLSIPRQADRRRRRLCPPRFS